MEQKVNLKTATEEVNKWLDKKKIMPGQREEFKSQIEAIADAISCGVITLNDDGTFEHELLFPTEGEIPVTSMKYKARINHRMLEPYLKGVSASDGDARILAHLACLTEQPKGVLKALDSADRRIANSIVVFFVG